MVKTSSLDEIIGYTRLISEIGEKAAGTAEEARAARLIEGEFKGIGLENCHLEPFPVLSCRYGDCQLARVAMR